MFKTAYLEIEMRDTSNVKPQKESQMNSRSDSHSGRTQGWNKHLASVLYGFALLLVVCLTTSRIQAQIGVADVLGTVSDASGGILAGAKVTITNVGTSAARSTNTNDKGEYIFNLLPNGSYTLAYEAPGFKRYSIATFPLSVGDRARYDAKLELGSVTEKVEVTGEVAALQTDSSTVSANVEEAAVQDLPFPGRNFVAAIQLQAGANAGYAGGVNRSGNSTNDVRPTFAVSANGQAEELNNFLIDGFDDNERSLGMIGLQPSIDGIAEMNVSTSSYQAEYGRTAGAVVNIITKSGTNKLHGSAYDYVRNDMFDAKNFFATGSTPEYRQNNFGGSLGGPIKRDKTFFFFDLEESRVIKGVTIQTFVPTQYERAHPGDLSDLCTDPTLAGTPPCPILPSSALNSVMLGYFNLFPKSQYDLDGLGYYTANPKRVQNSQTLDARLDHRFSQNNLFFARYARNPFSTLMPSAWPAVNGISPIGYTVAEGYGNDGTTTIGTQNIQLDYVHIFSRTLLLDLKAAYTRININYVPVNYGHGVMDKLGMPNADIPGLPITDELVTVGGPTFEWSAEGDDNPTATIDNTFQYSGSVTYTRGSHNIKLGAGLIRRQLDTLPSGDTLFIFVPAPPYFNDRANFLAGDPTVEMRSLQVGGVPGFRATEASGYVQDDWRATRALTLNLGLRYDVFTPFSEVNGLDSNFFPSTLASGVGAQNFILSSTNSTVGVHTDFKDIAPRVGFAYSVNSKTVLRGGFGMSYFPPDVGSQSVGGGATAGSLILPANPPFAFNYFAIMPDFANGPVVPSVVNLSTYSSNPNVTSLSYKDKNLSSAYVEQANVVSAGYVGVFGRKMLRAVNLDQPDPPGAGNPTPSYVYAKTLPNVSSITHMYNGSMSAYNALQLVFNRRITSGFSVNANYTWAHGMDDTSADYNAVVLADKRWINYGNSDVDIRHRIAVTATYEIPSPKHAKAIESVLLGGWQANSLVYWQTGMPFTVNSHATAANGLAYINLPGITVDWPDVAKGAVLSKPGLNQWFNLSAFSPQVQGTVSDERANQFYGPHDRRSDLSLFKNFMLNERFKLQFRAECFNLSNTPNFDQPNDSIGAWMTNKAGAITGAAGPNEGYTFGKITQTTINELSRDYQFALKLLF
jgi:hypothetical protein